MCGNASDIKDFYIPTDAQYSCFKRILKFTLKQLLHELIGFYNRDEKCLQRGTDWGFK